MSGSASNAIKPQMRSRVSRWRKTSHASVSDICSFFKIALLVCETSHHSVSAAIKQPFDQLRQIGLKVAEIMILFAAPQLSET